MPLSSAVARELTRSLLKAGASAQPYSFLYCPSDQSGEPLLQVSRKRIPSSTATSIRKTAKVKKIITGTVGLKAGTDKLVFLTKSPGAKLAKHIKSYFSPKVPPLKGALVEVLSEDVKAVALDARGLSASQKSVGSCADRLDAAEAALTSAVAKDGTASALDQQAKELESQADARAAAMMTADAEAGALDDEIAVLEAEMREKFGAGMLKQAMQHGIGVQDTNLLQSASTHAMAAIQAADEIAALKQQILVGFGKMALVTGVAMGLSTGKEAQFNTLLEKLAAARLKEQAALQQAGENGFTFAEERLKMIEKLEAKRAAARQKRQEAFDLAGDIEALEAQAETKRAALAAHISSSAGLSALQANIKSAEADLDAAVAPQVAFNGKVAENLIFSTDPSQKETIEKNLYGDFAEVQLLKRIGLGGTARGDIRDTVLDEVEKGIAAVDLSTIANPEQWLAQKARTARLKAQGLDTEQQATVGQILAVVQKLQIEEVNPAAERVKQKYAERVRLLNEAAQPFPILKADPLEAEPGDALISNTALDFVDLQLPFKGLLKGTPAAAFDNGIITYDKVLALTTGELHLLDFALDGSKKKEIDDYEKQISRAKTKQAFYTETGADVVERFSQVLYTRSGDASPLLSQISSEGVCVAMCLDWASAGGDTEALRGSDGKVGISEKHLVLQALHELQTTMVQTDASINEKLALFQQKQGALTHSDRPLPPPLDEADQKTFDQLEGMIKALKGRELTIGKAGSRLDAVQQEVTRLHEENLNLDKLLRARKVDLFMCQFSGDDPAPIQLVIDQLEKQKAANTQTSTRLQTDMAITFQIAPQKKIAALKLEMELMGAYDDNITPDNFGPTLKQELDTKVDALTGPTFFHVNLYGDEDGHATIVKMTARNAEVQLLDPNAGVFKKANYSAFLAWVPKWFKAFYGDSGFSTLKVLQSTRT